MLPTPPTSTGSLPSRAQELTGQLEQVWDRSDRIFALLDESALLRRPIALRHPFLFYLGHLPAFGWNQLGAGALDLPPVDAELDSLFERGIDPLSAEDAEAARIQQWPSVEATLAYRDAVRRRIVEVLPHVVGRNDSPLLENERVVDVVIEHEQMHHETLCYMLARMAPGQLRAPGECAEPRLDVADPGTPERVAIPAGATTIGAAWDQQRFGWDNEFPAQTVDVGAFALDALPVTVGRFGAFVDAGGYGERALWDDEGWAWLQETGRSAPIDWEGDRLRWMFGAVERGRAAAWPVHVSHTEARAFARWAGGRLPTEAELHRAAYDGGEYPWGDAEPDDRLASFGFARWCADPVGLRPDSASVHGVQELVGNGWEWTSTPFGPLPGFEAWMPAYPGYSADFFDDRHFVVFGGAWPTARNLLRRSFRNWYQGRYPYVFATFRLAWDA